MITIRGEPVRVKIRGEKQTIRLRGERPRIGIKGAKPKVRLIGARPKVRIAGNWKDDTVPPDKLARQRPSQRLPKAFPSHFRIPSARLEPAAAGLRAPSGHIPAWPN
jgi:hypothetical protein